MNIFLKQHEQISSDGPSWLQERRRAAMARFTGFPTTQEESWRYTSVEALTQIPFELASVNREGGQAEYTLLDRSEFYKSEDLKLVFVNGQYAPDLSQIRQLPAGVVMGSLSELARDHPSLVEPFLLQSSLDPGHPFVTLNTALMRDGAFLFLPKGVVVREPIYLCHLSWADSRPMASHPRNLIIAEEGSQATIVEIYAGGGNETYLTNAVTEVIARPGALIDHYKIQQESGQSYHIASMDIQQDFQSRVSTLSVSLGASLARHEVRSSLNAEGAECTLNGLYMVTGRQHVDNQTSIEHLKPHGTSQELYKGILSGQSRGVFNGRILVKPDAQKTSARQTNKNLILSDGALINTKPLLEIFANDVKCNHGATIGRLDENQIFYLRSRGLDNTRARNLLTYAFASDLVRRIKVVSLQGALERLIFRRLLASEDSKDSEDSQTERVGV